MPGPGDYKTNNYKGIFTKLPSIKIGTEKRFPNSNILSENPGPGQYNYAETIDNIKLK